MQRLGVNYIGDILAIACNYSAIATPARIIK